MIARHKHMLAYILIIRVCLFDYLLFTVKIVFWHCIELVSIRSFHRSC